MIPTLQLGQLGRAIAGAFDPFFSSVLALLHFDNTAAPQTFIDVVGGTWSLGSAPFNGVTQNTTAPLFGDASALFDSQDLIRKSIAVPSLDGDYTIEFAHKSDGTSASGGQVVVTIDNAGSSFITLQVEPRSGGVQFRVRRDNGTTFEGPSVAATGTSPTQWNRFRYTQGSGTGYLFINGVMLGSFALTLSIADGTTLTIGGNQTVAAGFRIDELRVTAGQCRSTVDYVVDAAPFPDA